MLSSSLSSLRTSHDFKFKKKKLSNCDYDSIKSYIEKKKRTKKSNKKETFKVYLKSWSRNIEYGHFCFKSEIKILILGVSKILILILDVLVLFGWVFLKIKKK